MTQRGSLPIQTVVTCLTRPATAPPRSYHAYCPPQFLDWQYRRERIQAELERYDSDIIFLQEVGTIHPLLTDS